MQTLNVAAGRTNTEYQAAQAQHLADLRAESQEDANYFFWAAGFAATATGFLVLRLNVVVNVGVFDLLRFYGGPLGRHYAAALYSVEALWIGILVGLGFAARRGQRWAFLAGIGLYAADMLALIAMFSLLAFGVHAFFVYRWFRGQKSLSEMSPPSAA